MFALSVESVFPATGKGFQVWHAREGNCIPARKWDLPGLSLYGRAFRCLASHRPGTRPRRATISRSPEARGRVEGAGERFIQPRLRMLIRARQGPCFSPDLSAMGASAPMRSCARP